MNKILIFISFFLISSIYSYIEGIDVSYYQGNIDWEKVKSEKQFAIIKMGYGNTGKDKKYEKYYEEAKSAGVQIGAYLYSYAKDATSAQKEANHALDLLKGKQFEWPIFYDIEDKEALKGDVNTILDTFCKILKDNNYYCGVYASSWYLNNKFDSDVLSKYAVWVAHYNVENPDFKVNGEFGNIQIKEVLVELMEMLIWIMHKLIMPILLKVKDLINLKNVFVMKILWIMMMRVKKMNVLK